MLLNFIALDVSFGRGDSEQHQIFADTCRYISDCSVTLGFTLATEAWILTTATRKLFGPNPSILTQVNVL